MTGTGQSKLLDAMEMDAAEMQASVEADAPMTLVEMIARAHSLTQQLADLNETVKAASKELDQLMTLRIPTAMDQIGIPEVGATIGNKQVRVSIDFAAYGSLTKAPDFEDAVDYLEANGFEGGVLTTVSAQFRREARADAMTLAEKLREGGCETHIEEDVNSSTLRAFARQRITEDPNFDAARVGVTIVRKAKFTVR